MISIVSIFTFSFSAAAFDANDYDFSFDSDSSWDSDYSYDWSDDDDSFYYGSSSSDNSPDWNDVIGAYDDYNSSFESSNSTEIDDDNTISFAPVGESSGSISFFEILRLIISFIFNLFT